MQLFASIIVVHCLVDLAHSIGKKETELLWATEKVIGVERVGKRYDLRTSLHLGRSSAMQLPLKLV